MSSIILNMHRMINSAGYLQPVVQTMKTLVAWIELCGFIKRTAGKQ